MGKIVAIDENLCIGCGNCVAICPKKILYLDAQSKKCLCRDESSCDRRRGCEKVCPAGAIKIS